MILNRIMRANINLRLQREPINASLYQRTLKKKKPARFERLRQPNESQGGQTSPPAFSSFKFEGGCEGWQHN